MSSRRKNRKPDKKITKLRVKSAESVLLRMINNLASPLTNGSGYGSWYFRPWPSRRQQKKQSFSAYYLLKVHLHHFCKIKSHKTVGIKAFFYYFCLMIEGSGSVPLTNWSGSRRPKNIRIRIRIHDTDTKAVFIYTEDRVKAPREN